MIAPTHAIYGPAIALIILSVFGVQASFHWTVIVCAMLGSIMPDIDHPSSTIGRLLPWISKPIERRFGHRAITHSALGTVVAAMVFTTTLGIAALVTQKVLLNSLPFSQLPTAFSLIALTFKDILRLGAAFTIGYASHLILDMITPRGIQLLWPNPDQDNIFRDTIQVETGSKEEIPVFLIGLVLLALAFPLSQHGPMTALRWFLATPESAIQEWKNRNTATFVEFEGTWAATKVPIKATAQILDVDNKRLVVLLDVPQEESSDFPSVPLPRSATRPGATALQETRTHRNDLNSKTIKSGGTLKSVSDAPISKSAWRIVTLSDELTADIMTQKVRLKTTTIPIHTELIVFEKKTRDALLDQISDTDLVSGIIHLPADLKIVIPDSDSSWKSIIQSDGQLKLRFATKSQLAQLRLDDAWDFLQRENLIKIKRLKLQEQKLNRQLDQLQNVNDGLTPLGRKLLYSHNDIQKRQANIDSINAELESVRLEIERIEFNTAKGSLLFDGRVRVWKMGG